MTKQSPSEEALGRYRRIEELAERRAARRRKRLTLYWWLLAVALVLAILTLFAGPSEPPPHADDIAADVVARLPTDSGFQLQVKREVGAQMPAVGTVLVSAIGADQELAGRLRELVAPDEMEREALAQELLEGLAPDVERRVLRRLPTASADLGELEDRVARAEESLGEFDQGLDERLQAPLEELNASLSEIERRSGGQDRRLDELAAELAELRLLVLPSLSYVVKAGTETHIPELGITVDIGSLEGRSLLGVHVRESRSGIQLFPASGAETDRVGLGSPLAFDTVEHRYQLSFGYSVNRWVARDLIGLEIRRQPR